MNIYACLPAVVKDVLGVDERNNMPLTLHFVDDFESIVGTGFKQGCSERLLRFFVVDAEEYRTEASEFILKLCNRRNLVQHIHVIKVKIYCHYR